MANAINNNPGWIQNKTFNQRDETQINGSFSFSFTYHVMFVLLTVI